VFIANIIPQSKAKKVLEVGDIIVSIDGMNVQKAADFKTYLNAKKKIGDTVTVDFLHDGVKKSKKIELIQLDPKTKLVGLGIYPEDEISIDAKRKITFHTEDIGGPSAGLMFSLEILSQILPEDIKKGYKIAGTGTIDLDGNVGQIGGIRDKIVAAHNQGVDIFLCPKDVAKDDTNEKEIKDEAKKLGYNSIKIVPVKTLVEAENYLKSLPPKK
ncbi:MAG: S16 family serine protease, partial [Bacillota bacterium]|nr:S16 family serine protease [Bacillota bacterium]